MHICNIFGHIQGSHVLINEHEASTTTMSKPNELQDDAPKFDFTAIPLCGIDDAESSTTLFQDGAATSTTTDDRGKGVPSFDEMITIDLVETTLTIRLQTCTMLRLSNR